MCLKSSNHSNHNLEKRVRFHFQPVKCLLETFIACVCGVRGCSPGKVIRAFKGKLTGILEILLHYGLVTSSSQCCFCSHCAFGPHIPVTVHLCRGQINIPTRGPAFACVSRCVSIFHCLSIKRWLCGLPLHSNEHSCNRDTMTVSTTQKTKPEPG